MHIVGAWEVVQLHHHLTVPLLYSLSEGSTALRHVAIFQNTVRTSIYTILKCDPSPLLLITSGKYQQGEVGKPVISHYFETLPKILATAVF